MKWLYSFIINKERKISFIWLGLGEDHVEDILRKEIFRRINLDYNETHV